MKFYEYLEQENITPLDIITDAERMEDLCHKIEGCHECPLKIPSCYLDVECNDRERNLIENNMKRLMEKESKKKNKSKQKPAIGAEYYVPEIIDGKPDIFITVWNDDDLDRKRYEAGVVFTDKYDAIIVAQKMLAVAKDSPVNSRDNPLTAYRHVYDYGRIECPKCSREFIWGYYDGEGYDEIYHCPYCGQRINVVDTEE